MLATLALSSVITSAPRDAEVTVYNQGFALVKERRQFELRAGRQQVAVEDVAEMIETNSVAVSQVGAKTFALLEQNYQYDLVSPVAILNKAVGGTIALNRVLPDGKKERIVGTLVSSPTAMVSDANGNVSPTWQGMVLRTEDGRILLNPTGEVEVTSLPEGLISKPTLMWEIESQSAGRADVELSYITQGTSWKSDYVLYLDQDGKRGDFRGWCTITNNSGATWKDAKLKLLAGDVMRAQRFPRALMEQGRGGAFGAQPDAGFAEESFAEYHLYTLQRPATVRNREIKQITMMEAAAVPVAKKLVIDSMRNYGAQRPGEGEVGTGQMSPLFLIELKNDKASQLGMPLPAGTFKVYQKDSSGAVQLLGEDSIDHTPRDEKISLAVGRSFDIVADRKRTKFEWLTRSRSRDGMRQTFVIEVRNRKETPETVHVYERHWGEWKVTIESHPHKRLDNETAEWLLTLAANQTVQLEYTVETYWP
ncbi:MAG: DUF4139 domain-containing protein [Fimbriimonadaceae bacterium]